MSKVCALCGASALAMEIALIAPFNPACARSNDNTLPSVTVQAPPNAKRAANPMKPTARTAASRQAKRQAVPVARTANVATAAANVTPSAARDSLNQAPTGQTATTVDRSQFDNKPVFSVADLLGDSPGIDMKQGNGPRDIGISIRGSNAREWLRYPQHRDFR